MTKRAIILVPGFERLQRNQARDRLSKSLRHYTNGWQVTDTPAPNPEAASLVARSREDGSELSIDVYETHWADLIPDWSRESPWARFKRGLSLITYWLLGGLRKSVMRREWPTKTMVAMLGAAMLLILWYVIVLLLLIKALVDGSVELPAPVTALTDLLHLTEDISSLAQRLNEWPITAFLIGLLGLGYLERFANVSAFTKAYLRDDAPDNDSIGLRAMARCRLLERLDQVSGMDYDEIFVVAHSLGGPIAVDALAEYGEPLDRIVLFTWGTALGALAQQEPMIEAEIRKFYTGPGRLRNWVDVVFTSDLMGSKVPVPLRADHGPMARPRCMPRFPPAVQPHLPRGLGLWSLDVIHCAYFRCEDALLMLVTPADALPRLEIAGAGDDAMADEPAFSRSASAAAR